MDIEIVLPYEQATCQAPLWAFEESKIDFRKEPERAARCTLSFAAMELRDYLVRTLTVGQVRIVDRAGGVDLAIRLAVQDSADRNERFRFEPEPQGLTIIGQGRTGVLYGVYELLRMQGWRWYAPGPQGQIAPPMREQLNLPREKKEYIPSLNIGRGFDFEGVSKESAQFLIWMARNRLNVCGYRPATFALANKLGMQFKNGGHVFEDILNPDRVMPSGKTLWQEHEEWFGLPQSGVREKSRALQTQFCVSRPDLRLFLAEELLSKLMGEFSTVDRLDVWGFDTWGGICTCPECRALGNGTDQILFLASSFREFLDRAYAQGRLDRRVRMVICAYEGTSTLEGPQGPVCGNLKDSGDCVVFYPINRCYAHDFNDPGCRINAFYNQALKSWLKPEVGIPVIMGEYYNVSKFEDLPLLFTSRIKNDLPYYAKSGIRGITYMHVPLFNWAMRTLPQNLYAELAWNIDTDVSAFVEEYFEKWYGPHAGRMRCVYEKIEEAWLLMADWRAWSARSVLTQLQWWDGRKPQKPLAMDNHFQTPAQAIQSGRRSIELLQEAMAILQEVRKEDQQILLPAEPSHSIAVNPIQARLLESAAGYEQRLGEDRRLLRYGLDTMILMTEFVAFHDARYHGDEEVAEEIWATIEQTADALDSYYIPIEFKTFEAGFVSKDALTRSQLRDLLRRCRQDRNERSRRA